MPFLKPIDQIMIYDLVGFEILIFLLFSLLGILFFLFILIVFESFMTDFKIKFEIHEVFVHLSKRFSLEKNPLELLFVLLGFLFKFGGKTHFQTPFG